MTDETTEGAATAAASPAPMPTPKPKAKKAKRPANKRAHTPGRDLVPDLSKHRASVESTRFYWVGVTPDCPVRFVDLAGINFPAHNENLIPDPSRPGRKKRQPVVGAIVPMNAEKIDQIRERLARTVIRFTDDKGQKEEPGTGQNLGDLARRPRRGYLITIPREEDVAAREKAGRPTRRYMQQPGDQPAARYMFAKLCTNQTTGNRGDEYPDVLEQTGLDWPGDEE